MEKKMTGFLAGLLLVGMTTGARALTMQIYVTDQYGDPISNASAVGDIGFQQKTGRTDYNGYAFLVFQSTGFYSASGSVSYSATVTTSGCGSSRKSGYYNVGTSTAATSNIVVPMQFNCWQLRGRIHK